LQAIQRSRFQGTQVRGKLPAKRIIPLAQLKSQLKQPSQAVRTFEAGASFAAEIRGLLLGVASAQALLERLASRWRKWRIGKSSCQPRKKPMPVHRRMPVIA